MRLFSKVSHNSIYVYCVDKDETHINPPLLEVNVGKKHANFTCRTYNANWYLQRTHSMQYARKIFQGTVLTIEYVTRESAGIYFCHGYSDECGSYILAKAQLIVYG